MKIILYSVGGIFVQEITVRFRSFRDVREFATLAAKQPFQLTVGTERYQVNATSVLGMFTLNCRKPLTVSFDCTQEEYDRFCREADVFLEK